MTFRRGPGVVHLMRPLLVAQANRGSYCGQMCFGMGAKVTRDPREATCSRCLLMRRASSLKESVPPSFLDVFNREVNGDPPVT